MNKTRFYINVETLQELNNEQKTELLADFKARLRLMNNDAYVPEFLRGSKIRIIRKLSDEDIMDSLVKKLPKPPIKKELPKFIDFCKHYDEAQGRYKCCNPLVITSKCIDVCEHYEDIRTDIKYK